MGSTPKQHLPNIGPLGTRGPRPKEDKYFSKVVGKALRILEILKRNSYPLSLNELTSKVGLAKSSVFRILHTLEVGGYLERNEAGHYSLSSDVRPLVPAYLLSKLIQTATPRMKELNRKFPETVSLAILFNNHIEVAAVVESPQLIRMGNTVGRIIPPHASSLGKSITAHQTEERREKLLRSYGLYLFTDKTITDEAELKHEFERVCARGYSTDVEESTSDGCCFGAPIFGNREQAIAAISISIPKMRSPRGKDQRELIAALQSVAKDISEDVRKGI
ncbi:IclR family transcriptional regulator [Acidobacteria bacterium AH-259-L09]|nr:IclR family transcriptional regulator [Acidobacteria bacterium AH-259-L09]